MSSPLLEMIVLFCRALRERGLLVSPTEAMEAASLITLVDLADRQDVYLALRTALATRREDYPVFDALFEQFWDLVGRGARGDPAGAASRPPAAPPPAPAAGAPRAQLSVERWLRSEHGDGEPLRVPRQSDRESVGHKDFAAFGADELEAISRLATRMARRLAASPSRRWAPATRGPRVDARRTIRRSLRTGGDVAELTFRKRKLRKTKLVALCDVSGSMDVYSRFLLQFVYALQNAFARVESFVFSTRISRVTDHLSGEPYRLALASLSRDVRGWSGGTRIGASLAEFVAGWPRLVDRRTVVVLLSDGWDTGDPEQLAEAMRLLHRRAGRVIWLNPLLGSPSYEPLTRGMQAALPHVDVFAPAHNLASLEDLVGHLSL